MDYNIIACPDSGKAKYYTLALALTHTHSKDFHFRDFASFLDMIPVLFENVPASLESIAFRLVDKSAWLEQ